MRRLSNGVVFRHSRSLLVLGKTPILAPVSSELLCLSNFPNIIGRPYAESSDGEGSKTKDTSKRLSELFARIREQHAKKESEKQNQNLRPNLEPSQTQASSSFARIRQDEEEKEKEKEKEKDFRKVAKEDEEDKVDLPDTPYYTEEDQEEAEEEDEYDYEDEDEDEDDFDNEAEDEDEDEYEYDDEDEDEDEDSTQKMAAIDDLANIISGKTAPHRALGSRKLTLETLKYFQLYPARVKQWVIDCKTPIGIWKPTGLWEPTGAKERPVNLYTDEQIREKKLLEPEKVMPLDLLNKYRFGVTEEDLQAVGADDKMRELLSFKHASSGEIKKFRISEAVKKWGRELGDTGSSEVQIAILTIKIRHMSQMLTGSRRKDTQQKRAIQIYIDRRRKLLKYLKKQNVATYYALLKDLNLRDAVLAI